jgi:SAM-dependent methyltransferase
VKQMVKSLFQTNFPTAFAFARTLLKIPYMRYCFNRPPSSLNAKGAFTSGESADDSDLISRLIHSYKLRSEAPTGQWSEIYLHRHADIKKALEDGDRERITEILRNPVSSDIFYGFDSTAKSLRVGGLRIEDRRAPALTLDSLVTLAEAIGARALEYPENYYVGRIGRINVDEIIDQIERHLGQQLLFPNPYPHEYGLASKRGIISYRAPQAIYQAWRIAKLLKGIENPKVLEIGAGLGRTAFYARQFGVFDYTIVDIPISSLAQGYFLGRTTGNVSLFGEPARQGDIRISSPREFFAGSDRYDLIINADSLTEIGRGSAEEYWTAIKARSSIFLSINHEANEFTMAQLMQGGDRSPYWMRRGYVEEIVKFN